MKIYRDSNAIKAFDETLGSKDMVIMVHAPWCGHCKSFLPTFQNAVRSLEGVKNARVIELRDTDIASCISSGKKDSGLKKAIFSAVNGYPTLLYLRTTTRPAKVSIFQRPRDESNVQAFIRHHSSLSSS